jgi:hypothetical protein
VTEVDTGFQQLLHGYDCHSDISSLVFSSAEGRSHRPFTNGTDRFPCHLRVK